MNHKKSMRIFWLSLSLLLISGIIIIAAAQFHAHKKAAMDSDALQKEKLSDLEKIDPTAGADEPSTAAAQTPNERSSSKNRDVQQTNGGAAVYLYELKIRNGCLEVYYYHTDRLFLHTGIPYRMLTLEQRKALQTGKYFKNEQELYGYLESCTS